MHLSLDLALHNLASVAVLAFALGALAARVRTDVQLPPSVYTFLSIYLLFGIGLKGGVALRDVHFVDVAIPSVTTLALGAVTPVLAFGSLKWVTRMSALDRGAVAAHYGSTSLVTFSAVLLFLDNLGVQYEGFTSTLLTIMEVPGIVVGIALGLRGTLPATADDQRDRRSRWRTIAHETLLGRTAFMLIGGLIIGFAAGHANYDKVAPFFKDVQPGMLALFLLHLGYIAGSRIGTLRHAGFGLVAFALAFPVVVGSLGVLAGHVAGLSIGGATVLGVLCASASYIAAPAAVSVGLPEANQSLPVAASLGITFPFNLIVGIPLLYALAQTLG